MHLGISMDLLSAVINAMNVKDGTSVPDKWSGVAMALLAVGTLALLIWRQPSSPYIQALLAVLLAAFSGAFVHIGHQPPVTQALPATPVPPPPGQ